MPLLPQRSSRATSTALTIAGRNDPTLPAILEFQSPSTAVTTMPVPRFARHTVWVIFSLAAACITAMGIIRVDSVVTAQGEVVSRQPVMVVQPLETSIVRKINVHPGEKVHKGEILAELNPTFAAADLSADAAQVSSLQAQVARMQAEVKNQPFTYSGLDPDLSLQAAIYAQRQSEYHYKLQNYKEQADALIAQIERAKADESGYKQRLAVAIDVENMRRQLQRMHVGSRLNTLAAMDNREEMQRELNSAKQKAAAAARDLAALIAERDAYVESWHAEIAQKLADATAKLSDARQQLSKDQLRRQLVDLRADSDGTVLSVAKVSVGSVLQSGQQLITVVPSNAPLEVEANLPGNESGYVHVGDKVGIKFHTFPFTRYGMAYGTVRTISADSFTAQEDQRNPTSQLPTPNGDQPYYRARITINKVNLHGVPIGFHLMPGMPVTSDVKVGKHTVLGYLLEEVLPVAKDAMREP